MLSLGPSAGTTMATDRAMGMTRSDWMVERSMAGSGLKSRRVSEGESAGEPSLAYASGFLYGVDGDGNRQSDGDDEERSDGAAEHGGVRVKSPTRKRGKIIRRILP